MRDKLIDSCINLSVKIRIEAVGTYYYIKTLRRMKVESMKILFFIVNKAASNGKPLKLWEKLVRELDKQNVNYRSFHTKYPNHATEIAKQIATMYEDKIEGIIAVGGDGTMNEVVNGLAKHPTVRVGFIPAGTGNDFSRGFNIPNSPIAALKLILRKQGRPIPQFDIGKATIGTSSQRKLFMNSLGVGFDAEVSKLTNQSLMKKYLSVVRLGSLVYVIALLKLLFSFVPTSVTLSIDGTIHRYQNVWFVTVSNQSFYGGGMKISPNARPNDGLLNITVIHNLSKLKLLLVFGTVFFGKHVGLKEVSVHTGREIKIDSEKPFLVHVDGEQVGHTPVVVSVDKSRISIFSLPHKF